MPSYFDGYAQQTHTYTTAWRHLNDHRYAGRFKIISHSITGRDADGCTMYVRVKAPHGLDRKTVQQVAWNEFDQQCRCEHDCCGHLQASAHSIIRPKNGKAREWIVPIHFYRNV